jgi:hypothetical protein
LLSGLSAWIVILAFPMLLVLASCDFGTPIHGGGGTEGEGLSGTLLDEGGFPAGGAWIRAYPADSTVIAWGKAAANGTNGTNGTNGASGASRAVTDGPSPAVDSARSNAAGGFRLKRLPAGAYNLAATVRRGDTTFTVFIPGIVYGGGRQYLGLDTLLPAGSASLQVYTDAGLAVGASCSVPGSPYHAVSDSLGLCMFNELPQGTFFLRVSYEGYSTMVTSESYVNSEEHTPCGAVALYAE